MTSSGLFDIGTLNCIYFAMVVAGLIYALGLLFLGEFGDGDHDFDVDGHFDLDSAIDLDHGDLLGDSDLHIFSPISVATFVTVFGATGLIVTLGLQWPDRWSLMVAAAAGAAVSLIVGLGYGRLLVEMNGTTEYRSGDLVGRTAQVITPIPVDGMGEVIFEINGERCTKPARSVTNTPINRNVIVIVEEVVGGTLLVKPRQPAA